MLRTVILVVIFLAAVSALMLTVIKPNAIRPSALSIISFFTQCLHREKAVPPKVVMIFLVSFKIQLFNEKKEFLDSEIDFFC